MAVTMTVDAYTWTQVGEKWVCEDTSLGEAVIDRPESSQYWICRKDGVILCRGSTEKEAVSAASRLLAEEAEVELSFEKHLGRREQYGRYSQIVSELRAQDRFDEFQLEVAIEHERYAFRAGFIAAKREYVRLNRGDDTQG